MRQVLEYMKNNPNAKYIDIARNFEETMEIPKQIGVILSEVDEFAKLRSKVRPLYAKRAEVEEKLRMAISDIETDIFLEYPPRKGSESQRETLRNKLKQQHPDYVTLQKEFDSYTSQIQDVEDELKMLEMRVKAARRLTETFSSYMAFMTEFMKNPS